MSPFGEIEDLPGGSSGGYTKKREVYPGRSQAPPGRETLAAPAKEKGRPPGRPLCDNDISDRYSLLHSGKRPGVWGAPAFSSSDSSAGKSVVTSCRKPLKNFSNWFAAIS